ncbi:hypothetical protein GCM10023223_20410 [Stackebrandtia albiflava]
MGEVVTAAGVGRETLRYYERRGLIARPPRSLGGHRRYPAETVERLRIIKGAQRLGFTLDEIAALLARRGGAGGLHATARDKLAQIHRHIAQWQHNAEVLHAALAAGCDDLHDCAATPECPLPFPTVSGGVTNR